MTTNNIFAWDIKWKKYVSNSYLIVITAILTICTCTTPIVCVPLTNKMCVLSGGHFYMSLNYISICIFLLWCICVDITGKRLIWSKLDNNSDTIITDNELYIV